jgi:hypothetical protein
MRQARPDPVTSAASCWFPQVVSGEVTEGSFRLDLRALFADDERGVALVIITASRGGRSVEVREAHVFHMRDGTVVEFWNASADQYAFDELIG